MNRLLTLAIILTLPLSALAAAKKKPKTPCQAKDGGFSMQDPFPEGMLREDDYQYLYNVELQVNGRKKSGRIDLSAGCQVQFGGSGMSYGWACKPEDVKAAYAAVCAGRRADMAQAEEELARDAQRLASNLEHHGWNEDLLGRYQAFMDSEAPDGLKEKVKASYEKGAVRHFGQRQYAAGPDGFEPNETDSRAQQLWAAYQDPDCLADEACQAEVAGTFEERIEKYQKTLEMQAASRARREEREAKESEMAALKQAKEQAAANARSACEQSRGDYHTFMCPDMENAKGEIRKIGPTANQCRKIQQRLIQSGCF